ncbi:AfsR/SARP family transcriptional regulator [Kribbella steppae]|uniref:AfsR/SARP family transcriptional regulator n=1 Tax=Kribbella steppae TaxID=2512223 RepID=UPI001A7E7C19|nr:bacterial transcriptional activator domain-containing protein [Kribbella steppae]
MLAFLALHSGRARRVTVAGTLWPDTTEERALSSLRTAVWNLSRLGVPLVQVTPTTLSLMSTVAVDAHEAALRARQLIDGQYDLADVPGTLQLLRQEMLVDWAEDWILVAQEQFRQLRLHALEALGEQLLLLGRHAQAVVAGLDAIACEPLRETAHLLLMKAYLDQGNRSAAIHQYQACARLLRDELGLRPSEAMTDLLARSVGGPALHDVGITVA